MRHAISLRHKLPAVAAYINALTLEFHHRNDRAFTSGVSQEMFISENEIAWRYTFHRGLSRKRAEML